MRRTDPVLSKARGMDSAPEYYVEYQVVVTRQTHPDGIQPPRRWSAACKENATSQQLQSQPNQEWCPPGAEPKWACVPAYAAQSESQAPETPAAQRVSSSAHASVSSGTQSHHGGEELRMTPYSNHWKSIDESAASPGMKVRPTSTVFILGLVIFFLATGAALAATILVKAASSGADNGDVDADGKPKDYQLQLGTKTRRSEDRIIPVDFPRRTSGAVLVTNKETLPTLTESISPPLLPPEEPLPDVVDPPPYPDRPVLALHSTTTQGDSSHGGPSEESDSSTEEKPVHDNHGDLLVEYVRRGSDRPDPIIDHSLKKARNDWRPSWR